jgi:hypothetical protein
MTGTLHEDLQTFMMSRSVLLRIRNVSIKSCTENQNTHLCPILFIYLFFFFPEKLCHFLQCYITRTFPVLLPHFFTMVQFTGLSNIRIYDNLRTTVPLSQVCYPHYALYIGDRPPLRYPLGTRPSGSTLVNKR